MESTSTVFGSANPGQLEFYFSIDRGGTFTDIFCDVIDPDNGISHQVIMKLLSVDLRNYKDAPTEGIRRIVSEYTR